LRLLVGLEVLAAAAGHNVAEILEISMLIVIRRVKVLAGVELGYTASLEMARRAVLVAHPVLHLVGAVVVQAG